MEREATAGTRMMKTVKLTREVEVDATGLGKFWVKNSNPCFADQIQRVESKSKQSKPAYPVHVRLVGALQRRGAMAVYFLPPKVTLPKAVPPVEALSEIRTSGVVKNIDKSAKTALYSDGAVAWKSRAHQIALPIVQVRHQMRQFTSTVAKAPRRGLSCQGGTQCLDRAWGGLKRFLPKNLHMKSKKHSHSVQNPHLKLRVYQWLWRRNMQQKSSMHPRAFTKALAKAMRWRA